MYPLTDDFMIFDNETQRYILTEKDVNINLGINILERLKNPNTLKAILKQVSNQIYMFIHKHSNNNDLQDYVISHTEKGRKIIKEAMEQQLIYYLAVGDLSKSTDEKKRALAIDMVAQETLMQTIPEIRTSICYTGNLRWY